MLSSMYKKVDSGFVGAGNWTMYAYWGRDFFRGEGGSSGFWEVHSEKAFFFPF